MSSVAKENSVKYECQLVGPVFLEYRNSLARYINSRVKDTVESEELLSEVMEKIYDNCEKLTSIRHTEAWLITIARNTITDYFRGSKRRYEISGELNEETDETFYQELETCIPSLINRLPKMYAGPLVDYELKGIPQKDLAVKYQLSESGLKSRVQRGRKLLKTLFRDYCVHLIEEDGCGECEC